MILPNVLTISRLLLTIGFIFFLTRTGVWSIFLALILFMLAVLTDYYDGYLAKKHHAVSNFGKIMDPIADKFLVLTAFFVFMRMQIVAEWMFVVIFIREITVTGSRFLAMKRGRVLAAELTGKWKTVLQTFVIFVILNFILFYKAGLAYGWISQGWACGIYILMLLTVGLTLLSGLTYFWNNRKVLLG